MTPPLPSGLPDGWLDWTSVRFDCPDCGLSWEVNIWDHRPGSVTLQHSPGPAPGQVNHALLVAANTNVRWTV